MFAELGQSSDSGLYDFEAVRTKVTGIWEEKLSKISITTPSVCWRNEYQSIVLTLLLNIITGFR